MHRITSPKTSIWIWRAASLPMRTGRESSYPLRWSRVYSRSEELGLMPYKIRVLRRCSSHSCSSQRMYLSAPYTSPSR